MGCTSSVERSDGDMQPRRMLEVDELWNTSSQSPFVARPPLEMNNGPQVGRPTSDTHIRGPGEGSNFLGQNISLLPNQPLTPEIQHWPRTSFPQANQQYQDPWEARGCKSQRVQVDPTIRLTLFLTYRRSRNLI